VASESSSRWAAAETSSIARSKAGVFACDGAVKPEILRTNCSAAARTSSSVAGGSKLNNGLMARHIGDLLAFLPPPGGLSVDSSMRGRPPASAGSPRG
jgi:hypothetical protein